jgi:Cu-Zn family superoxide dismutase
MKFSIAAITTALIASAFSSAACKPAHHMQHKPTNAIAYITGSNPVITGSVTFTQTGPRGETQIFANITGLTEGKHGLHVHELGDLSNGKYSLYVQFIRNIDSILIRMYFSWCSLQSLQPYSWWY